VILSHVQASDTVAYIRTVCSEQAVRLRDVVQVSLNAFAFEASDDIIEGGGRYIQPGSFTVSVEQHTAKLVFRGDPLEVADWHALRKGEIVCGPLNSTLY
jgi:hypothetical protein